MTMTTRFADPEGAASALRAKDRLIQDLTRELDELKQESTRYCEIWDDDGHRFLCPADRADEAQARLDAICRHKYTPGYPCPSMPHYLRDIDGGRLTFTNPEVA